MRHDRACTGTSAVAKFQRRDQHCIRSNEYIFTDLGRILFLTIVIAGDRPGANVGIGTDHRIADVGEMPHLDTFRKI